MTHYVVIALASNHQQEKYLSEARQRLLQMLSHCRFTEAIWTAPINAALPDMYLNQLLYAQTDMTLEQVTEALKQTEILMGRTNEDRCQGIVRIDLDLMRYDDQRYHVKDWERDYIKKLL